MNRKLIETLQCPVDSFHRLRHWLTVPAGIASLLLAVPAQAGITIPDLPLTLSSRVAPNLLFILDDSGSMEFETMPDELCQFSDGSPSDLDENGNPCSQVGRFATGTVNVARRAFNRNTLYYNPGETYLPWVKADGSRMTGGTSYAASFGSFNLASGTTINLGRSGSCGYFNAFISATIDERPDFQPVCGGVQTFYVLKDAQNADAAYEGDGSNYYQYQILANGTGIQRAEYGPVIESTWVRRAVSPDPTGALNLTRNAVGGAAPGSRTHTLANVTANGALEISVASTQVDTNRAMNFIVNAPGIGGAALCAGTVNAQNSSNRNRANSPTTYTCRIPATLAGSYAVTMTRNESNPANEVGEGQYLITARFTSTSNRCSHGEIVGPGNWTGANDWVNCVSALPVPGRTLAAELRNYATWFSYHRTRMKAAKAGASQAFRELGNEVRVGFRTIWSWHRSRSDLGISEFNIPVNDGNDGRFVDNPDNPATTLVNESTSTRSQWYSTMQGVLGQGGTPLHAALYYAGEYFKDGSGTGPYGPETGSDQLSCRQNFTILTTDGYYNDRNIYDAQGQAALLSVGNVDGTSNPAAITGPGGKRYTYSPAPPYSDAWSDTLADVAMQYWKTDLRPDLVNNVPTSPADPAFWQHMVTFGIAIGLDGTTGWKGVSSVPSNAVWPAPGGASTVDDLLHATVNGRGAFVTASSPKAFSDGLQAALARVKQRTASFSNVATNSTSLNTGAMVFDASFNQDGWTGSLRAHDITTAGVAREQKWEASVPSWNARRIFTSAGANGQVFPTAGQSGLLARTGGAANFAVTAADNAAYIKGDKRREGEEPGQLRVRRSALGDVINSSPTYVKDTNTVYVGANDGMLHAFDASTGKEIFAYVPANINMADLATLSRADYSHKFFVDGPIAVSSRALTPGTNILVGSLGRGGRGLYSLNVGSPASATASSIFNWELAETKESNMGLVLGAPVVAKVKTSSGAAKAAVIAGNGPNSANDKAVLIIVDLNTGAVIREINTNAGSTLTPNGLLAPTGIYGADGQTVLYVYAGDMLGNVWKFDLTSSDSAVWSATRLFTASKGGVRQPITGAVTVAVDPEARKQWVFFGTGRYLTTDDATSQAAGAQSMYGVIDEGRAYTRTNLTARSMTATAATSNGFSVRSFQANARLPADSKGWYLDLPAAGERIVQDAQIVGRFLITASMIPESPTPCANGTGSGYLNAIDAFTGTAGNGSYFDLDGNSQTDDAAVNGLPVGSVSVSVGLPTRPLLLPGQIVLGGSGGEDSASGFDRVRSRGMRWVRVSWRELRGN